METQRMQSYVVAVRRQRRDVGTADWIARVREISGLVVVGDSNPMRVQVEATDEAAKELRERLGDLCHIEAVIQHKPCK